MARPAKNPPHGMEDYDMGALSDEQQASLSMYKVGIRAIIAAALLSCVLLPHIRLVPRSVTNRECTNQ